MSLFPWYYKGCSCCGRVLPDSRDDQLGECQLCQIPRELTHKPLGWDQAIEVQRPFQQSRWTTLWLHAWMNRTWDKLCPHEQRGIAAHMRAGNSGIKPDPEKWWNSKVDNRQERLVA